MTKEESTKRTLLCSYVLERDRVYKEGRHSGSHKARCTGGGCVIYIAAPQHSYRLFLRSDDQHDQILSLQNLVAERLALGLASAVTIESAR